MQSRMQSRWKRWAAIALASLGIHYLMLALSQLLISGHFSFPEFYDLLVRRLTTPGDAERYLDLAKNGYVTEGENAINLVFYPLYPLLIQVLGLLTRNLALSGVILSQVSYAFASILLYELIALDGDARQAWDGVLLMALYPFSMFVMGVFSEGLFLLLSIGCLYALRKRRFLWAGVIGFLAALSRTQGMLLLFPAVCELLTLRLGREKRRLRGRDLGVLLIPAGFGVYLLINYLLYHNCFQFLIYEADKPWYQTTKWIGENIASQYRMALDYRGLSLIIYWAQIALYFLALGVIFYGIWKKEQLSDLLYAGVYLGFTYLSGWMISGGRYMLCCVPLYIILARLREGRGRRLLFFILGLLFFTYSYLYMDGHAIM